MEVHRLLLLGLLHLLAKQRDRLLFDVICRRSHAYGSGGRANLFRRVVVDVCYLLRSQLVGELFHHLVDVLVLLLRSDVERRSLTSELRLLLLLLLLLRNLRYRRHPRLLSHELSRWCRLLKLLSGHWSWLSQGHHRLGPRLHHSLRLRSRWHSRLALSLKSHPSGRGSVLLLLVRAKDHLVVGHLSLSVFSDL